jgi:hypothetical protein
MMLFVVFIAAGMSVIDVSAVNYILAAKEG